MANPYPIVDGYYVRVINGITTRIAPAPPGTPGPAGLPGRDAPIYSVLPGATFDLTVAGTTVLGTPPAAAVGAVFLVSGGDIYAALGTVPTSASPAYAAGAQLRVTPIADAVAFQAVIKQGAPHLIGQWLRRDN